MRPTTTARIRNRASSGINPKASPRCPAVITRANGRQRVSATRPAYEELLALPDDEQRARVATLREAELACDDGDRLDILVGDGGPGATS